MAQLIQGGLTTIDKNSIAQVFEGIEHVYPFFKKEICDMTISVGSKISSEYCVRDDSGKTYTNQNVKRFTGVIVKKDGKILCAINMGYIGELPSEKDSEQDDLEQQCEMIEKDLFARKPIITRDLIKEQTDSAFWDLFPQTPDISQNITQQFGKRNQKSVPNIGSSSVPRKFPKSFL